MDKTFQWFPCELHCHTLHSDGDFTVEGLLQTARERGLAGISLTDHNTTAGWAQAQTSTSPAVLCGIEWTTYFGRNYRADLGYVLRLRTGKSCRAPQRFGI